MIQAATLTNTQAATLAPKLQPYAPRLRPYESRRVGWARRAMTRRAGPCGRAHGATRVTSSRRSRTGRRGSGARRAAAAASAGARSRSRS